MAVLGLAAIAVAAGVFFLVAYPPPSEAELLIAGLGMALTFVVLVACLLIFRTLTIEVGRGRLAWWYGPGWPRRSLPLSEITGARRSRTTFWDGWGIRWTRRGWLWNINGYEAVEFERRAGRMFRLGTDDPAGLLAAVEEAGVTPAEETRHG